MFSRVALAVGLAAAALVPSAVSARSVRDHPRIAEKLSDPMLQARVTTMMALMSEMMLDLKVGPLARVMGEMGDESARSVPEDARLRDLAGPEARDMPRQIAREMPRAMGQMSRAAGAMEDMLPEFERMADQMRRAVEKVDRKAY
jgi:hypothetical protein